MYEQGKATLVAHVQRVVEMAEVREGVLQQLQSLEAAKMRLAEQKLAEQTRLCSDLDVRLQAACSSLDCSAGKASPVLLSLML